jgi:hypothetical protein
MRRRSAWCWPTGEATTAPALQEQEVEDEGNWAEWVKWASQAGKAVGSARRKSKENNLGCQGESGLQKWLSDLNKVFGFKIRRFGSF